MNKFVFFIMVIFSHLAYAQGATDFSSNLSEVGGTSMPRLVFAHYMVCCSSAGSNATIEDVKNEIKEAQSRGIDGFALNSGGWTKNDTFYRDQTTLIYEAARQLGSNFKLFVSMDFCCVNGEEELRDAIRTFRSHPNQFLYRGKPVISTFEGQDTGASKGKDLIEAVKMEGAIFVPYFYPSTVNNRLEQKDVDQLFDLYSELDGYFYFGAAALPDEVVAANRMYAKKWMTANKLFLAAITPYYRGTGSNSRLFDTKGFEGMAREWEGVIANGASSVELVTWNDFVEATYIAPYGPPDSMENVDGEWKQLLSHVAYLDASKYYINWFKSGVRPEITNDELFYFFRVEPKSIRGPTGELEITKFNGAEAFEDEIYVTTFLKSPADLKVVSGRTTQVAQVNAGVQHTRFRFQVGQQRFLLERAGKTLIDKVGEIEILDKGGATQFNYFGGSAR